MDTLDKLRQDINAIDQSLMELLNKRFDVSIQVGQLKQELNMPVLDSKREQLIYNKTSIFSHSPQINEVYKTIMEQSKSLQGK